VSPDPQGVPDQREQPDPMDLPDRQETPEAMVPVGQQVLRAEPDLPAVVLVPPVQQDLPDRPAQLVPKE